MHGNVRQNFDQYQPVFDPARPEPLKENQIDVRAVLGVIRRRKWTIITAFLFIVTLTLLAISQLHQKFTAEALLVVDRRDSQLVGFDNASQGFGAATAIDTEVEIARSSNVLRSAAGTLGLGLGPNEQKPGGPTSWLQLLGLGATTEEPILAATQFAELPEKTQAALIDSLSRSLQINRRGLTNVISIQATASSAADAAERANAVADAYLHEQITSRLDSTERAVAFLSERVDSLSKEITAGETQIDAFVSGKLQEFGSPVARSLLERISVETKARQATGSTLRQIQDALRQQDYTQLARLAEGQQADLAVRRQTLLDQMRGDTSGVATAQAKQRLDELDQEIAAISQKRVGELQVDVSLSDSRAANFRRQLETSLADMQLPKDVSAELVRLQRDVETRRSLYDSFLTKLRQVEQQTDFNMPDLRIVAYATAPAKPSFPPTQLILASAILFSLGAGIGLAFLRENFIGGITSAEQFEHIANIPVVASVPLLPGARDRASVEIIERPLSAFSEAIRRICIGVDSLGARGKHCIFVTSALPGDGKTTLALSLARHFALTGSSTLMIDADLRHPSVHQFIDIKGGDGLINFLSKGNGPVAEELAIAKEPSTGLHLVLGTDASMVATDALLMSGRFDDLLKFARRTYDVIIVDTPPIGLVVDAAIVARHCDSGILVTRYASTTPQQIRAGIRDLTRSTNVTLCGVLNQVAKADHHDGTKYRHYYGSNV